MENFNLKQYIYEKKVEGMTDSRIAETLGITVDEMNGLLNPAPVKEPEPPKAPEEKPEPPKATVEEKKPEVKPDEAKESDNSWLED